MEFLLLEELLLIRIMNSEMLNNVLLIDICKSLFDVVSTKSIVDFIDILICTIWRDTKMLRWMFDKQFTQYFIYPSIEVL